MPEYICWLPYCDPAFALGCPNSFGCEEIAFASNLSLVDWSENKSKLRPCP